MNQPGETGHIQSGPGFEQALRACLVCGIVLVEIEGRVAKFSPDARDILGVPADKGLEVPLENLPPAVIQLLKDVDTTGKHSSTREIHLALKGATRSVQVSAMSIDAKDGKPRVVLAVHSLNPTSPFVRQIRQLDRLANTGTLAAGMAHEIKNALVAGRTFLDLLLEKNADTDLVDIVRRETGRIDSIVTRMLRFSGTGTTALATVHLHQILEHALRLVQPHIEAKSIRLERSFAAPADITKGDEYELQQAFVNLLLNGLEAMSDHGRLRVSTEQVPGSSDEPNRIRIAVSDDGAGILPENMSHLFEPFFTTKETGTGLGLAITSRIIQEHSGSISVESRPGQGTTFTILLPMFGGGQNKMAESASAPARPPESQR